MMGSVGSRFSGPLDESIKMFVDESIRSKRVVVFSKTYCPYCKRVKEMIAGYQLKPDSLEVIEIEKRPDCSQIQSYLKMLTGASTVPRIFVEGKSIGGCDDLTRLHESGELATMLSQCGAI